MTHCEHFFNDLHLSGCITQVGAANKVLENCRYWPEVESLISSYEGDLYFLAGVERSAGKNRATDEDINKKNYIYFDFDLRKNKKQSDKEIKQFALDLASGVLKDSPWRYIVYTGNGIHVYFFSEEPITVYNKTYWKLGMIKKCEALEKLTNVEVDKSCVNVSRIARVPGSFNHKSTPPKDVEILLFQDVWSGMLSQLEAIGESEHQRIEEENRQRAVAVQGKYPSSQDTFKAIQEIPIGPIVTELMGWKQEGRHFYAPGSTAKAACFISEESPSLLIHGGCSHIPSRYNGYRPWDFVQAILQLENGELFKWFKDRYPEIQKLSAVEYNKQHRNQAEDTGDEVKATGIGTVFSELQDVTFEHLNVNEDFNPHALVIRGAVTRLAAYSNIGKSKLAYFIAHQLLKNEYKGMIFSTEVQRSLVLAHMLCTVKGCGFWDIVQKRVHPTMDDIDFFSSLQIYDVTQTGNSLEKYANLVKQQSESGLDFVIIDYCQAVEPQGFFKGEYEQMTRYALQVQKLAQETNVAVIDLSQIANAGIKDELSAYGFISMKGSGHLYSSADIAAILNRKKNDAMEANIMNVDVRKHKYKSPSTFKLECDFKYGHFEMQNLDLPEKIAGGMPSW